MKGYALLPGLAWLSMVAAGFLSLVCNTGWLIPSVPPDLVHLSTEIGPITRNFEIKFDPDALGDLPPERFSFQSIEGPQGQTGSMYIAYYTRSRRWSGRPHDLDVCYRAMGYEQLQAETWQTERGATLWARDFRRGDQTVRVVHWVQQPGRLPGPESLPHRLTRLVTPQGLRQDIASIYFEFDLANSPSREDLTEAAQIVIDELETLWQ